MHLRKFRRVAVDYPIAFAGDGINGTGTLIDLSTGGCAVKDARPISTGTYLALTVTLPDSAPLAVEMAAVRWARGDEFGADFISLREEEEQRLRRTLGSLERAGAESADHSV